MVRIVFILYLVIKIIEVNKIIKYLKKLVNFMEIFVMEKNLWFFLNLKSNYVKYMWNIIVFCV